MDRRRLHGGLDVFDLIVAFFLSRRTSPVKGSLRKNCRGLTLFYRSETMFTAGIDDAYRFLRTVSVLPGHILGGLFGRSYIKQLRGLLEKRLCVKS